MRCECCNKKILEFPSWCMDCEKKVNEMIHDDLSDDKKRLDWLDKLQSRIYFNASGNWEIECSGDDNVSASTVRQVIDLAMEGN